MGLWYSLKRQIIRVVAPYSYTNVEHNLAMICGFSKGDMFGELNPKGSNIFTPGFWYDSSGKILRFFSDKAPESHYSQKGGFVLDATGKREDERLYIWQVTPEIKGFVASFVIDETIKRYNNRERAKIYYPTQIEQNK